VDGEALLDAVARGIRRRVEEQARAEERLARFVFREGEPVAPTPGGATASDWRYFVARTLREAGEPGTLALLERIGPDGRRLAELADGPPGSTDRSALADRVGRLSQAGLLGRELETDRVTLTPLGEALLALADELARRAGEVTP